MNQRLQQFLAAENISQAQFADTIEVARASVSHVLAGRNKPGYDFIRSLADHYPKLNLEWLISGKGKMYKQDTVQSIPAPAATTSPAPVSSVGVAAVPPAATPTDTPTTTPATPAAGEEFGGGLFGAERPGTAENPPTAAKVNPNNTSLTDINAIGKVAQIAMNKRNITKVIVFYDDDTYQELK